MNIFKAVDKLERFKDYAPIGIRFIFFLYLILAIKAQSFLPGNIEKFASNLAEMIWLMQYSNCHLFFGSSIWVSCS